MSVRLLAGGVGVQRSGPVQVPPDGIVVDASSDGHEEVPDGVGKGDAPVAFEEHHAQAVEEAAEHQLQEAVPVGLEQAVLSEAKGLCPLPTSPVRPKVLSSCSSELLCLLQARQQGPSSPGRMIFNL